MYGPWTFSESYLAKAKSRQGVPRNLKRLWKVYSRKEAFRRKRVGWWELLSKKTVSVFAVKKSCFFKQLIVSNATNLLKVFEGVTGINSLVLLFALTVHTQAEFTGSSFSRLLTPSFPLSHPQWHNTFMQQQHFSGISSAKTGTHQTVNMRTATGNDNFSCDFIDTYHYKIL